MKRTLSFASACALMALVSGASATVLMTEDFNFSGELSANGWTAHSGSGTNNIDTTAGLTYAGYAGSGVGNAANLDNTGEDVNRVFAEQTSGTVYTAFLVNVPTSTVTEGYFLHLGQVAAGVMNGSTFHAKVYVATDGTGDFELGLTFQTNAPIPAPRKTAMDLAFNTTYLVVLKHEIVATVGTDDLVSLYVFTSGVPGTEPGTTTLGPFSAADDSSTDFTNVGAVALRQFNANQRVIVDGIRVGDNWSDALGGVASVSDWMMH